MTTVIVSTIIVAIAIFTYLGMGLFYLYFAIGGCEAVEAELSTIRRNIRDAKKYKATNILWPIKDEIHISVITAQLRSEGYSVTHLSGNDVRISWEEK